MTKRQRKGQGPSNIRRRSRMDIVKGKNIRKLDDGTDNFRDYLSDDSRQTTEFMPPIDMASEIVSILKTTSGKTSGNRSILSRDSVSNNRSALRSSKSNTFNQESGGYEDYNGYFRSEHFKRCKISGKKLSFSEISEISRGKSHFLVEGEISSIANSRMTQTSHSLDETESSPSKNRVLMRKKPKKSNEANLFVSKINSSVRMSPTKLFNSSQTPDRKEDVPLPRGDATAAQINNNDQDEDNLNQDEDSLNQDEDNLNQDEDNQNLDVDNQKSSSKISLRSSKNSALQTSNLLKNRQVSSSADSRIKTVPQDVIQENASSPCTVRRPSRYKCRPLAIWRNEHLKFVKSSSGKEYECVGVEEGQTEDDYVYRALRKRQIQKIKIFDRKKQKIIPKELKKTPISDVTGKTIELYLYRPFSSYEWTLHQTEDDSGYMVSRTFQSQFMTFGFLDIAGHSKKGARSPENNLHFIVIKGVVEALIRSTSFTFQKGDSFIVPAGTAYCFSNETFTNALLSYNSFKVPIFTHQEYQDMD